MSDHSTPKVLIVSHAHPDRVAGGGQAAAHRLFLALLERGIDAHFLAAAPPSPSRLAPFGAIGDTGREILCYANGLDPFTFSREHLWFSWHDFRELLERLRPDVVHFHHYVGVGVDLIREVKNWSPNTKVLLTLHEFCAICHNGGRMVKNKAPLTLCHRADAASCNECFPELSAEAFHMRKLFLQAHFEVVDQFISPSHFVKQRYEAWGIPGSRIEVMENGTPHHNARKEQNRPHDGKVHFAFFGKVFRSKGILLFLEALELLPTELRHMCRVSIRGAGIEEEDLSTRTEFEDRVSRLGQLVRAYDGYVEQELPSLMADVDWLVVPSLWWENSPLVIQEAFTNRVPVICANVGGMAEKVRDGVDGLHFRFNDASDLARVLTHAVEKPELRTALIAGIRTPPTVTEIASQHLELYQALLAPEAEPSRTVTKEPIVGTG